MRTRKYKSALLIALSSALTFWQACQDPPAFVEHAAGSDGGGDLSAGGTDTAVPTSADAVAAHITSDGSGVITKKFQAAQEESLSLNYPWGGDTASQNLTMTNEILATTSVFKVPDAAMHTELFAQTPNEGKTSETFVQTATGGVLDIVVVIDNSGSMASKQANVANKLQQLLQDVNDSQWRINVVTTDPRDGCMRALIQKGDQNVDQAFAQAVNAGTAGSGSERGLLQAVNALGCNGGSWLRQNSSVAVLIVSDEDNCSDGNDCAGQPQATTSYLTNYLNSIRQVGVNARVYGIFWRPSDSKAQCAMGFNQANIYADAVSQTSGTMGSICDADYSGTLQAISKNMAGILKNQYALQHIPLADSLKIYINDQLITSGYAVSGTVIDLQNAPSVGASIRVEYEYHSEGTRKDFTLAKAATPAGMQVFGDKVLIAPSSYSYDANQHAVVFTEAPSAHEIKIVYYESVALTQDFALKDELVKESLVVKVNGSKGDPSAYKLTINPQTLHFQDALLPGSVIEASYDKILRPRLRYPVVIAGEHMQVTEINDQQTAVKVDYTLDGEFVVFDEKDFSLNRSLIVHYHTDLAQQRVIELGANMVVGSPVEVKAASGALCDTSTAITGTEVNLSQCPFNAGDQVMITFTVMSDVKRQFTMDDPGLTDPDKFNWTVLVNDQPITSFEREQNVITIEGLKFSDVVTIAVRPNT